MINIDAFRLLDEIRDQHNIKIVEWAEATWGSSKYQSRISELRGKARGKDIHRICSCDKAFMLVKGLQEIIDPIILCQEVAARIEERHDLSSIEKCFMLVAVAPPQEAHVLEKILINWAPVLDNYQKRKIFNVEGG